MYHFTNYVELLSIIFCLGMVRAKKYKIIDKGFDSFDLSVLVLLTVFLGSIIIHLSTPLIIGLAFSLPMYFGGFKSWLNHKLSLQKK